MAFSQRELVPELTITTALASTIEGTISGYFGLRALAVEVDFVYGSSGTSLDCFIQTTFDGTNWFDIMNFAFGTSSDRKAMAVILANVATPQVLTDGTMTNNTSENGLMGDKIRAKVLSVGTYAGGTTLTVRVMPRGGGS